jgi:aminopeptidase
MDWRVDKVAEILVNYSVEIRPGDLVMIHMYEPPAEPLALAVYKHVLQAGGYGIFRSTPSRAAEMFYQYAHDEQFDRIDPQYQWLIENIDVRMALRAPTNTKALSNVDPALISRVTKAQGPTSETFMRRQGNSELRWVVTQFPTLAAAQDAEMSLTEYEDFIYGAAMVHLDDPVAYWQAKSAEQDRLIEWLAGKDRVEVKGEHVDLTFSVKGRTWENADGRKNFPDGELFTGPVEDSMNGWIRYTYPAIYQSREVNGVELTFEAGRVVKATAEKGETFLNAVLDTDAGARYLGEFAIGTNEMIQQFTKDILFDEKIGGTIHMAVGAGYPDTGSVNKSAVHWDMICDMRSGGKIVVDGELFYKDGEFQV